MVSAPRAFLSYTRIDDDFFGGAITALRKSLELGVQVVTGDRSFAIFQDVDGIELGQQWQERLDEAVASATFLIPIMTPCFFSSPACRDELRKFIQHEKSLKRGDLVLPIYFVTSPVLERSDLIEKDELAREISKRQRLDWRIQADLPMTDPAIRKAVRQLADAIASAIKRSENVFERNPTESAESNAAAFSESAARIHEALDGQNARPKSSLLWVDDHPANNTFERQAISEYNIDIKLARSTNEALKILGKDKFDVIISDMGRPPDMQAGYTLLQALRESGNQTPYFIYAGSRASEHTQEAFRRGAQGNTNRADELIQMVLNGLDAS